MAQEEAVKLAAKQNDPTILADKNKTKVARQQVAVIASDIAKNYHKLQSMRGLVDPNYTPEENIGISVSASRPGQALGTFMGSEEQEIRNMINTSRPLLLQQIRQATEMGVKGMDTPKELEFYLQAATDPKYTLKTNLSALRLLNDIYGIGGAQPLTQEEGAELERLLYEEQGINPSTGFGFQAQESINDDIFQYMTPEERSLFE